MPKRGATIYGEIVGFATNCDAAHITQPQRETMQICMEQSLAMAGLGATDIGYISAHGTATDRGDIAESRHCGHLWRQGPLSSLKSYFGHTLGACGALEAWMSVQMMREGWFAPTLNLRQPDEQCGALDYIMGKPVRLIASICKAITSRLAASIPQSLSNAGRNYVPVYTGKISTLCADPLASTLADMAPQGARNRSPAGRQDAARPDIIPVSAARYRVR